MGTIIGMGSKIQRGGGGSPSPNLQDKDIVITENGDIVITADSGYAGLNQVGVSTSVEIPSPSLQDKSINITENGSFKVNADAGYDGLSEVEINTNVPIPTPSYQGKTVSIVENGTVDIVADSGYDALSNVRIQTNIPEPTFQEKTIDIKENGISSIIPDVGYGGLSKVNINVDVPQGGGADRSLPVLFFDYDGTLLHSYTIAEAQALTSLPELPTHDLLTGDGWTHTLAQVNGVVGALHVGAQYRTTDGKTHAWVTLTPASGLALPICFTVTGTATIRIDWGDGQTQNATATSTLTHNYATYGDYEITLERISGTGTYGLGRGTSSLTFIGVATLNYRHTLTKIFIGDNAAVGAYAFYQSYSLISLILPKGIAIIATNAFIACVVLTSVIIPEGVVSIEQQSFSNCANLTSVIIPDGVVSIGTQAFYTHYSLPSLIIPASITSVGQTAFATSYLMRECVFKSEIPPSFGTQPFVNINSLCRIYVPDESVNAYKTATNMAAYANYIYPISSRP